MDFLVHTHHQNSVVERKHRHIVELWLSLLSHASLPLSLWDHAFLTVLHLINKLPLDPLNFDTPYHVLFQNNPDYQFLRVFVCSCYPLLHPYHSHKLKFRSIECVFLGYSPSHKGYKCMSSSGKKFMSKDIIFNEPCFPYPKLFSTSTTGPIFTISLFPFSTTLSLVLFPVLFSLKIQFLHLMLSLIVLVLMFPSLLFMTMCLIMTWHSLPSMIQ